MDTALAALDQRIATANGLNFDYFMTSEPEIEQHVRDCLNSAWRILIGLLDSTGQKALLDSALARQMKYAENPLVGEDYYGEMYFYWAGELSRFTRDFRDLCGKASAKPSGNDLSQLKDVLKRTARYLVDQRLFGWVPVDERDVHERIEGLLHTIYSDVRTKPRINKPIKNFEPDTYVVDLNVIVEYKYVASTQAEKRVMDEVLADVLGYSSPDESQVVFFIYQTRPLMSEQLWNAALTKSNADHKASVIVVRGFPVPREGRKLATIVRRKRVDLEAS